MVCCDVLLHCISLCFVVLCFIVLRRVVEELKSIAIRLLRHLQNTKYAFLSKEFILVTTNSN